MKSEDLSRTYRLVSGIDDTRPSPALRAPSPIRWERAGVRESVHSIPLTPQHFTSLHTSIASPMNPILRTAGAVALGLVLVQPAYAAQLTQYWPLDEAPGSATAANAVAGGNTGTLVQFDPANAWVTDKPAMLSHSTRAIAFSGGPEYVNFQNIHRKGSATVSLWVKPATFDPGDVRLYSQVPYVTPYGVT